MAKKKNKPGKNPSDGLMKFLKECKKAAKKGEDQGIKYKQYAKVEDPSCTDRFESEPEIIDHWMDYLAKLQEISPEKDLGPNPN